MHKMGTAVPWILVRGVGWAWRLPSNARKIDHDRTVSFCFPSVSILAFPREDYLELDAAFIAELRRGVVLTVETVGFLDWVYTMCESPIDVQERMSSEV